MPAVLNRDPRQGHPRRWRSGAIIALCGAAAVAVLASVLTRGGDDEPAAVGQAAVATPSAQPVNEGNSCQGGRSFYVAPAGRPEADGQIDTPLDLATALSAKSPATGCDTIWLRAGTYRGAFTSALAGSEGKPVVVRQYPGERAIIDSAPAPEAALRVTGSWTWYWGFEVTNSDPDRTSEEPGQWPGDLKRGAGVASSGSHVRFINLVVHDMARGFEVNENAVGTEFYGNIIYNNGWEGPQGAAQGNGIDTRNQRGYRRLLDNIIFNQFSHGIAVFGEHVDHVTLEGNVVFNNGSISRQGVAESRNILLGGSVVAADPVVRDNVTYNGQTNLGYSAGCSNSTVTDNYFAGPLVWVKCAGVMKGNTLYDPSGGGYGTLPSEYPDNTYSRAKPSGVSVRVRRNQYEPGRANVIVLNWDQKSEVGIDPADAGLAVGDRYEVRDAQDYFGKPVASGTYSGGTITLPTTQTTVSTPVGVGLKVPAHTLPELAVFVIRKADAKPTT